MKVLLLGATGLLGHNVLQRLMAEGHAVVALVRRPGSIRLRGGGWQEIVGSPVDYESLSSAAESCEAVINCAGVTDMSLRRLEDYLPVNRDLAQMIVRVMEEHGIRRLVHISTVNTIGHGYAVRPADETMPMREPFVNSLYAVSKKMGEQAVIEAARRHPDWHTVVINPGFMLGAWDVKPSSGRMLQLAYNKRVAFAPRGGKAFVAVQDVAEAAVNALTKGENGERYIATNSKGCLSVKELYQLQARVMGYRQSVVVMPDWVLAMAGRVGDMLRSVGVKTDVSTCNVKQLMVREYYDNSHGTSALDYHETPIEDAIVQFHRWIEENAQ